MNTAAQPLEPRRATMADLPSILRVIAVQISLTQADLIRIENVAVHPDQQGSGLGPALRAG